MAMLVCEPVAVAVAGPVAVVEPVAVFVAVAEPVSVTEPVAVLKAEHMAVPVKVWVLFVKVCFQEALAVVNFTK
jgi:hypothetical protein